MAELICPSCDREAPPDPDPPFCEICVVPYIPRPPAPAPPAAPDPPTDENGTAASPPAPLDASTRCTDPDCPHDGVVPQARCLACARSNAHAQARIRFPWGLEEIPERSPLAIGRIDLPLSVKLAGYGNVSRHHATLQAVGNNVVLVDLGSANGTFVNDVRLDPRKQHLVHNGDRVRFAANLEATIVLEVPR